MRRLVRGAQPLALNALRLQLVQFVHLDFPFLVVPVNATIRSVFSTMQQLLKLVNSVLIWSLTALPVLILPITLMLALPVWQESTLPRLCFAKIVPQTVGHAPMLPSALLVPPLSCLLLLVESVFATIQPTCI